MTQVSPIPASTLKQVAGGSAPSPSLAPAEARAPSFSSATATSASAPHTSHIFDSLLSSSDGSYVPPGVSTLTTLNSLAFSLALRVAPVTVAHSAPIGSAGMLPAASLTAPAALVSSSPSASLRLEPSQQFPLKAVLDIPLHGRRGPSHAHWPHTPSHAQLFEFEQEEETQGKWWHSTASGIVGGISCVYAGQPFDTVKVRIQAQSAANPLYAGPLDCLRKTVAQGGYRSLYKGSSAALASVVLENAVLFTANSFIKEQIKRFKQDPDAELTLAQEALAGGFAGFFSSTAITPAEVIKCRLQVQDRLSSGSVAAAPLRYRGPVDALSKIVRSEGLKGLFSGLPSVWMRDIPFNFVFLGSYEAYCAAAGWAFNKPRNQLGPAELFVCGGLAGVSGWSIVFPMDFVKSKVQTSTTPVSSMQVIRSTLANHGPRAFYQGWSAAVMRAFPANAALLMGVELSRRFFEDYC